MSDVDKSFRKASFHDAADISALVNSCYRGDLSRRGWTSEAELLGGERTNVGDIEALLSGDDSVILLCMNGKGLVGSVHLQRDGSDCYLGMLVVSPELQRGGIGKKLMLAAEALAQRTWPVTRMTMTVISVRRELISFYERRGYRQTGLKKPFVADGRHGIPLVDGIDFEVLVKDLVPSSAGDVRDELANRRF